MHYLNWRKNSLKFLLLLPGLFFLASFARSSAILAQSNAASLELYGTFHAMGITVTIADTDDPNENGLATVEYRRGSEPYQAGFPLSRINRTRFVGSLFWLEPGTLYDVRVTFSDPDGDPLSNIALQATAFTRAEVDIPAPSDSFIVSPTGTGTACSLSSPCPLLEGVKRAQPGDEVVLRGGVYYQGEIVLPRSGTPGAPIVIRGYDNEVAVLDGADPTPHNWTPAGDGLYTTTSNIRELGLVAMNGTRLYPYQDLSSMQSLSWGIPGFYADGTNLYLHLVDGTDPNNAEIAISRYNRGFKVNQDYIYFLNLTLRHYGQGSEARAIYFDDASNNLVQGSTFALNNGGITIRDVSHRNVIQDNEFYDTIFDWPWDGVKATGMLERGGVYIAGSSAGRGNVVRRNIFHDFFDGFDVCPREPINETNETDVYDNLVYNTGDDGVQVDGYCTNVRLWDNTFHDVLVGISFAPIVGGPVYAIRNLIYHFGVGNTDHPGKSFKFNNSDSVKSGPIYIMHNTVDTTLPDRAGLRITSGSSNGWVLIYARNNIWSGTSYAVENRDIGYPIDLDHDNLWSRTNSELIRWDSTRYDTLAAFSQATGQEPHGLNTDPGFAGAQSGQYGLNSTSPLVDAGVLIPGINHNFVGSGPDIGALESGFEEPTNVPVPTETPVPPTATPAPTDTPMPTATPAPTETPVPPTDTPMPTETPLPPTETPLPPTETPVPPTDTPIPTETPVPPIDTPTPTETPAPPIDTPAPAETAVPPTNTPTPTETPVPSTDTPTPTATPAPTETPVPPTDTPKLTGLILAAEADAPVEEANPDTNYGTSSSLNVSSSGEESYIRFTVTGVTGTVQNAKLRLFVANGSADGPSVYGTDNSWSETGITWNNRPAPTTGEIANVGVIVPHKWIEYDVTALVTGDGTYSFVFLPDHKNDVRFSSRESGSPPELVVIFAGSEGPP